MSITRTGPSLRGILFDLWKTIRWRPPSVLKMKEMALALIRAISHSLICVSTPVTMSPLRKVYLTTVWVVKLRPPGKSCTISLCVNVNSGLFQMMPILLWICLSRSRSLAINPSMNESDEDEELLAVSSLLSSLSLLMSTVGSLLAGAWSMMIKYVQIDWSCMYNIYKKQFWNPNNKF